MLIETLVPVLAAPCLGLDAEDGHRLLAASNRDNDKILRQFLQRFSKPGLFQPDWSACAAIRTQTISKSTNIYSPTQIYCCACVVQEITSACYA